MQNGTFLKAMNGRVGFRSVRRKLFLVSNSEIKDAGTCVNFVSTNIEPSVNYGRRYSCCKHMHPFILKIEYV